MSNMYLRFHSLGNRPMYMANNNLFIHCLLLQFSISCLNKRLNLIERTQISCILTYHYIADTIKFFIRFIKFLLFFLMNFCFLSLNVFLYLFSNIFIWIFLKFLKKFISYTFKFIYLSKNRSLAMICISFGLTIQRK
jgi:hypothetical protein